MTGYEIIANARKAQAQRKGERVKVRIPLSLCNNVRQCAAYVNCSVEDYVCSACRHSVSGRLSVPIVVNMQLGTRKDSETVNIRVPKGFDTSANNLRSVLLAATAFTMKVMSYDKPSNKPVEGRDYILEGRNYTRITQRGIV